MIEIKDYSEEYEKQWLRCRVLAFLDTAYFDNVLREKEIYENPSLSLIALEEDNLVGLIEMEIDTEQVRICSNGEGNGAMIWHLAVHPDHQMNGIGGLLLKEAIKRMKALGICRLEAWTRDDIATLRWYEKHGFIKKQSYYHVYLDGSHEMNGIISSQLKDFYVVESFGHYIGDEIETLRAKIKRIHECNCFELIVTEKI